MAHLLPGLRYDGGKYDVLVELAVAPDVVELDEILSVEEVSRDPILLVEDVEPGLEQAILEAVSALAPEDFACAPDGVVVNLGSSLEVVTIPVAEHVTGNRGDRTMQITLKLKGTHKGTSKFAIGRNTVRIPLALFPEGTAPATLEIAVPDGAIVIPTAKPKLTKEERAALRAAMTPEQKIAAAKAKADKAQARLNKLQAELAL
ncbi:MAG: hypothetical protein ABFD60_01785 [Bryobacteraceae bacterium]